VEIKWLSDDEICNAADVFLDHYHPGRSLPVPIDLIAERDLGLEIVTIPGLQEHFEVEGHLSSDLKSIYVDDYIFKQRVNRFRFTIAHELGHFELHKHLFDDVQFGCVADWKQFLEELDPYTYKALERQGPQFGAFLLAPRQELRTAFLNHFGEVERKIEGSWGPIDKHPELVNVAMDMISEALAPIFEVSQEVIAKRIITDKLLAPYMRS
jgi:hypothetical protein